MPKFYCEGCRREFDTERPVKKEYRDYILGPCPKNVAYCPDCGSEAGEKIIPRPFKAENPKNSCDGNCRRCDVSHM